LTVAVLFLLTLLFAPIATAIPVFATAPALLFVACMMARGLRDIDWDDATEYVPATVVAVGIPFTFSIAAGIGLGFIVYVVVKAAGTGFGSIAGAAWLIAGLSLLRFVLE
jgi:adenine/guanine/hypoxanthine permease